MASNAPVVVSSPGKVLIAGGYLVLDPAYSGVVVSTSSRFYTVIQESSNKSTIRVRSPQFENAQWSYSVGFEPSIAVEASSENSSKNKFVHLALQNTLALAGEARGVKKISEILSKGLDITIVGDNDFYSQRAQLEALGLPRTLSSLSSIQPFSPQGVSLADVHKTGLGSSAALITSLVSSLLLYLGVIPPEALKDETHEGRYLAHNVSQFIHCLAQGKIGSGFDVSAAVFGSHIYTRFTPAVLEDLMGDDEKRARALLSVLSTSNKAWDHRVRPFALPPLTRIILADVDAGSDTPSLVGKVLKWRKEDPEKANALWNALDTLNQTLAKTLLHLSDLYSKDGTLYTRTVSELASSKHDQWSTQAADNAVAASFSEAHQISEKIREKMREMGSLAGVPIEPPEQTKLLDASISQSGVISGGVPGAGGYDAVWVLVFDPVDKQGQQPAERIDSLWSTYKELDVSPLSATESKAKGIHLEDVNAIRGLKELL
ncbi:phosphomevalonate kinase [Marasmius tenuissimus]|uniref:Phosphomevalonate kinase n=1 Tax=Marasmius tenuissimus TaxID=585030 RepID=A0ABR2ZX51_9AGAR